MSEAEDRLAAVRERIVEAAQRACRSPDEVTLVAVSKTVPAGRVREIAMAGQHVFGENRVQEALDKMAQLADLDLRWHLIGHLQTNKARPAAESFALIESVDSARLAQRLDTYAERAGRMLPVLLEVNVAAESSKSGFAMDDLRRIAPELAGLPHVSIRGLMTVAPLVDDVERVRRVFRQLRELRDELRQQPGLHGLADLSMGMSNDFGVAIEEGATMVRLGRALFGDRPVA